MENTQRRKLDRIMLELKSPKAPRDNTRKMLRAIRELTDIIIQMRKENEILIAMLMGEK